jgi:hypothetical protein
VNTSFYQDAINLVFPHQEKSKCLFLMLRCGNIVLLIIRFFNVSKFTTRTALSLLISCEVGALEGGEWAPLHAPGAVPAYKESHVPIGCGAGGLSETVWMCFRREKFLLPPVLALLSSSPEPFTTLTAVDRFLHYECLIWALYELWLQLGRYRPKVNFRYKFWCTHTLPR